ncbi:SDR family oxidoreductase [Alteromonadaceae bacterium BrNp21-10]|nr:SDR family oxidoreductase [Alteromonadaceae bacterium BrNp21-10]
MANVLITGANRGIGLALSKAYIARGDKVWGVCRQSSHALEQSGAHEIEAVNMAEPASFKRVVTALGDNKIDLLINNAGVLATELLSSLSPESIQYQFQINALAPILFSQTLLAQLNPQAKIAVITSRMGSMADNGSGGYYGYRMSKAALNAGAVSLARDLEPQGHAVAILHPGFVQTDMVGGAGDVTASESAVNLMARIDGLTMANTGTFWHANGEVLPW